MKTTDINASEKAIITKAKKLLTVRRELVDKIAAVDAELWNVLNGGASIGDRMRAFTDMWLDVWQSRYRTKYSITPKEGPAIKRLVQRFEQSDLTLRAGRFIRKSDDYYVRSRHNLLVFESSINEHIDEGRAPEFELSGDVADCQHQPPCRSESEHSRKRTVERKAID